MPVSPAADSTPEAALEVQRGSGDAALAAAVERSESTASTITINIADVAPLPLPLDTANLRLGPGLADENLILLPLVGVWRGEGKVHTPGSADTAFGQQLTLSHDGRGFLRHESLTWLIPDAGLDTGPGPDTDPAPVPANRELGWWRPQPDDIIELLIAHSEGVVEIFYGHAQGVAAWSLGTDAVVRTVSAPAVTGATRLYGIVDGKLAYVEERATAEYELQPYRSALLERVAG
ncbi:FABP family protein [Nakamurella antarctica]|uniref:Ferric nitrobindin-like protein n=1 Tax=Nakamurella antarctica TaxID=1902245 RepID=A0A3G8ZR57_9ACTN|nr:FABP family protein [Nakamurella antarctica]